MKKYQQIVADITSNINQELLPTGAKLATVREMMTTYQTSKATVLRSMQELVAKDLIYVKNRSGYFVLGKKEVTLQSDPLHFDFSSSGVTWTHFPFDNFQKCVNQAMEQYQAELFRYGTPKGISLFTETLEELLEEYAVYTKSADVFVTSGIQEALFILSQIDFPNGKQTILVEQPGYNTYLQTLRALNKDVISINRHFSGLDLSELERLFREESIKFFYLMPRIHNPLGTTLPQAQMKKIVELAERYDVYLIEDDYLADFVQDSSMLPLHYYDTYQRVIYLKSFSKIVFPGIRLGAVVLPKLIQRPFEQYKLMMNISTDLIAQLGMTLYISNGMFAKNKRILEEQGRLKAAQLKQSMTKWLTAFKQTDEVCVHSTIELPTNINKASFINSLKAEGITVDTLEDSYLTEEAVSLIKLNVTKIDGDKIDEGIKKIADILQEIEGRYVAKTSSK